ncbi:MAG: hypothetical protein ACOC8P_02665 [Dichotomicrobium sp.]
MSVRISYGVICDDVRREDNGKLILIGVYARDMKLAGELPAQRRLSFLVALEADSTCDVEFEASLLFNDEQIFHADGEGHLDDKGLAFVRFPPAFARFKQEGELVFKARIKGGEWMQLWRGNVYSASS